MAIKKIINRFIDSTSAPMIYCGRECPVYRYGKVWMSSTREQILNLTRSRAQATTAELAEYLAISPVSVRHHLSTLMAEGLVRSQEVRHGVGRPHLAYSLTEAAL